MKTKTRYLSQRVQNNPLMRKKSFWHGWEVIEETDPVIIEDVFSKCRNNLKDRRYYLKLSAEEVPKPTTTNNPIASN